MDKVEDRKEKIKPQKLFTMVINIWDDGVLSGYGLEYRNMGRLKKQKMIIPGKEDFLSSVRSIVPSAIPAIETITDVLYGDLDVEDAEGSEKTSKITIDIYNDGFVDSDFSELNKGPRGAPRAWRMSPHEFVRSVDGRHPNLSKIFSELISNANTAPLQNQEAYTDDVDEDEE